MFSSISNMSNLNVAGKIVNSVRIATDVLDMVNLVGPAANIKTKYVVNQIRHDLKITDLKSEQTGDIDRINEKRNVTYSETQYYIEATNPNTRTTLIYHFDNEKQREEYKDRIKKENWAILREWEVDTGITDVDGSFADGIKKDESDSKYILPRSDSQDDEKFTDSDIANEKEKNNVIKPFSYRTNEMSSETEAITAENISIASEVDTDRWYDLPNYLGKIYVMPPNYEMAEAENGPNKNVPFSIPLQNNITFEQISRGATWNAVSFFGRIGDVQQYSKTDNLAGINLSTKYFVESNDAGDYFTISKLQDIEMMYRSLVLPAVDSTSYLNDNSDKGYYYFTRPPIINIVLGNPNFIGIKDSKYEAGLESSNSIKNGRETNTPYHNLFTDIYTVPNAENSSEYDNDIFYKNFVVTNVTIDKNLNDYNYVVEDKGGLGQKNYYDTNGFTVTLTVLEIDENYLGSLPSFTNYENTLRSRKVL